MMLYNSGRSFGDFIPTQTHPKNRNVLPCKKTKTKPDGNPKPIKANPSRVQTSSHPRITRNCSFPAEDFPYRFKNKHRQGRRIKVSRKFKYKITPPSKPVPSHSTEQQKTYLHTLPTRKIKPSKKTIKEYPVQSPGFRPVTKPHHYTLLIVTSDSRRSPSQKELRNNNTSQPATDKTEH